MVSGPPFKSCVLITGGASGLGYEVAVQIATLHPGKLVVIANRSAPALPLPINIHYEILDLGSMRDVRRFADHFSAKYPPLEALVLNAGIQVTSGITYTEDHIESTFGVNHVGHALLVALLETHMANEGRIVITASGMHDPAQKVPGPSAKYTSAAQLAKPAGELDSRSNHTIGAQRYATSKLCNVLYLYALDRHLRRAGCGKNVTVTAIDPGFMPGTGLARDAGAFGKFVFVKILPRLVPLLRVMFHPNTHPIKDSAAALVRLVVGKDVAGLSGKYFEGMREIPSSNASYDVGAQDDLWEWTKAFTAGHETGI
ncbi:hypothetical protein HDU88_009028 [Geranomyces variabilis]|nr:hypothetical protein HDU88_009028 [Geranomyces variabilis]